MRAPRAVETARVRNYERAMNRFGSGAVTPVREDLTGYEVAKRPRWDQQREKCAYCDRSFAPGGHHTEHFRPILGGYWWLAWDWDNLLFACVTCNGPKSHVFELLPGSHKLQPGERPPGQEHPKLINPLVEDPLQLIAFKKGPSGAWEPTGTDPDRRGEETIGQLGLRQHYNHHQRWATGVLLDIRPVEQAVEAASRAGVNGQTPQIRAEFDQFILRNYNEFSELRSLTWAVWNDHFSPSVRQERLLVLPPPRTPPLPVDAARVQELALLDTVSSGTRERLYALGQRAPDKAWDDALIAVLGERARSVEELTVMCAAERATVLKHLKRLEAAQLVAVSGRGARRSAAMV